MFWSSSTYTSNRIAFASADRSILFCDCGYTTFRILIFKIISKNGFTYLGSCMINPNIKSSFSSSSSYGFISLAIVYSPSSCYAFVHIVSYVMICHLSRGITIGNIHIFMRLLCTYLTIFYFLCRSQQRKQRCRLYCLPIVNSFSSGSNAVLCTLIVLMHRSFQCIA